MCKVLLLTAILILSLLPESSAAGDAAKLADLLPGVWRGESTVGGAAYQHLIRVQKSGAGWTGVSITWFALTEDQAQAAARGQKPKAEIAVALCVQQQFAIKLEGEIVTFKGYAAQNLFNGTKYSPDILSGKLIAPGIVAGDAADAKKTNGIFRLWKDGVLNKPLALTLAKGKTQELGCVDGGNYHYTCYLPKNYDPDKPAPVLINFSPGGGGQPLNVKAAEETGWIMAGLTESKNGEMAPICENRDAVFFDLCRRFNVDMKHVYFSGLSGGARAASSSGVAYPGICAGVICIGAAYGLGVPPKDQAIFYIAGETDMNKNEVKGAYDASQRSGRKCALIIHPGGHEWGRDADHEAAVKWMHANTEKAGAVK